MLVMNKIIFMRIRFQAGYSCKIVGNVPTLKYREHGANVIIVTVLPYYFNISYHRNGTSS